MHSRWQDISMMRMSSISDLIESEIASSFRYVFCFDVDQEFKASFGSEGSGGFCGFAPCVILQSSRAQFQPMTKTSNPKAFQETGEISITMLPVFGGLCENVKNLTDTCYLSIMEDKINGVEALWHDESHLNKYFWLNKPSKVLSPRVLAGTVLVTRST